MSLTPTQTITKINHIIYRKSMIRTIGKKGPLVKERMVGRMSGGGREGQWVEMDRWGVGGTLGG